MAIELSPSITAWKNRGRMTDINGRQVFVTDHGDGDLPLVLIHGFPGSSHDWSGLVPLLSGRVITLDLPGYGFSDKSFVAGYTLFEQTDVVEAVLADLGVTRCVVVGHDMGDTVTAELAHRSNAGELAVTIEQIILTNGSVFIDLAQLTRGQRLTLRTPNRASLFPMPTVILRRSLMESFTKTAPPPPGAVDDLIAMIKLDRGDRLMPRLIRYIEERRVHQDRWTAGFVEYPGPLTMIWGEEDPIAVLPMTERMQSLRPATTVVRLPGVGHWTSIEAPEQVAEELAFRIRDVTGSAADLVFLDLPRRLVKLLLATSDANGLSLTQTEIADQLGAARTSVNRNLSSFQRRGWIEIGHKNVRVLNREALVEFGGS